ncbi:MAG: exosortase/archaeosortase family protein, partial [Candidatus Hydrogenedentes bacterium]|nr:exosortase/archaeosortase family protein [Candidatus Hydrogenedentota bacterium]
MAVPAGRVIVAFAPADARERFAPHPRHAAQTAIGIAWVAGSFVAVWAAIPEVADRWFKAWGSPIGAWMFLFAAGAWLYLQLAPGRGAIRIAPAAGWTLAATVMAAAYVVTWGTAPQLVRCQLAAAVVGCTMLAALGPKERRGAWGILLLMLLCVHVATSLDFFIGFPLRLVSSELAAAMLGPSVWASGTALSDGSAMYFVDAPCSGVKMLSASLGLGAGLAVLYRLRPMRTIALVPVAFALAIVGNAHRAATLFITHASPDDPVHGFIGVIVFAECAAVLWLAAEWLKRARWAERQRGSVWLRLPAGRLLSVSFIAACFAGAALPVASPSAASVVTA